MNTSSYYEHLPDTMAVEELRVEFLQVLAADPESEAELMSEALFALSERQWNTYELVDGQIRKEVAAIVLKLWDDNDADRAEALLGVTSRLGLEIVLKRLQEKDWTMYSADVRKTVEEAIGEFGDTVDDPYSGMRK